MRPLAPPIVLALALPLLLAPARPARAQEELPHAADSELDEAEAIQKNKKVEEALRLRKKDIDRGRAYEDPGSSSLFALIGLDQSVRDDFMRLHTSYVDALDAGAPADHPRMKAVRAHLDEMRKQVEAAGIFIAVQLGDPDMRTLVDQDDLKASRQAREDRELFERGYISSCHSAYDMAHDALLRLEKLGDADAAAQSLARARRTLELDRYRDGFEGVEKHPAYGRAKKAVESKFAPPIEAAVKKTQAARDAARKAVDELRDQRSKVSSFVSSHGGLDTNDTAAMAKVLGEIEAFERNELQQARAAAERFVQAYGEDDAKIDALFETADSSDKLRGASGYLTDLREEMERIAKLRRDHAASIMSSVRIVVDNIDSFNPDIQVESIEQQAPRVDIALRFDPANADARQLSQKLEGMAAKMADAFVEKARTARMPENGYSGSDREEIEQAIIDYFREDSGWGAKDDHREEPLCVVLTGDWDVASRNIIGEIMSWGVPCKVAFWRSAEHGWERDRCVVFDMTMYTVEVRNNEVKGPPFDSVSIGQKYEMLRENLPWDVGRDGQGTAGGGPGGGGAGGVIFWLFGCCCCFLFLAGAGGGGYYAYTKSQAGAQGGDAAAGDATDAGGEATGDADAGAAGEEPTS